MICDKCKQAIQGNDHYLQVQKIEEDDGTPVENAPIVYFHKECLDQAVN